MIRNPILSIIIPLYNSASIISRTINGLTACLDQLKDVEIILVNDGSCDDTDTICLSYTKRYSFVKYYEKENGGIADARNYGIRKASGKYLFFHDHDDEMSLGSIPSILNVLESSNCDLFLFEANKIENGVVQPFYVLNESFCDHILSHEEKNLLFKTMFFIDSNEDKPSNRFGHIWATIVKKEFLITNNISFVTRCDYEDDFTFLLEMLTHDCSIICKKLVVYNWVIRKNSFSHSRIYNELYFEKLFNYITYLENTIDNSQFAKLKDSAIVNISWRKNRDYLLMYGNKDNGSFKEFKTVCLKNNVRKPLIAKVYFKKSFNQRLLSLLFILKFYWLCYKVIRKK